MDITGCGSDEAAQAPEGVFLKSSTHPRAYGCFARLLGKYVREEKVISLEEAVRRLSGAPAATLDALREVIGALDEHLLACLKTAAPRVPPSEWQKGVARGVHGELLPKGVLWDIASALAAVHRVKA